MLFAPPPPLSLDRHKGLLCACQAIVNLYCPGKGIMLHINLLNHFGDGIVGMSGQRCLDVVCVCEHHKCYDPDSLFLFTHLSLTHPS